MKMVDTSSSSKAVPAMMERQKLALNLFMAGTTQAWSCGPAFGADGVDGFAAVVDGVD
jgi:hypothetical protein